MRQQHARDRRAIHDARVNDGHRRRNAGPDGVVAARDGSARHIGHAGRAAQEHRRTGGAASDPAGIGNRGHRPVVQRDRDLVGGDRASGRVTDDGAADTLDGEIGGAADVTVVGDGQRDGAAAEDRVLQAADRPAGRIGHAAARGQHDAHLRAGDDATVVNRAVALNSDTAERAGNPPAGCVGDHAAAEHHGGGKHGRGLVGGIVTVGVAATLRRGDGAPVDHRARAGHRHAGRKADDVSARRVRDRRETQPDAGRAGHVGRCLDRPGVLNCPVVAGDIGRQRGVDHAQDVGGWRQIDRVGIPGGQCLANRVGARDRNAAHERAPFRRRAMPVYRRL